jgi:hypothetical protein
LLDLILIGLVLPFRPCLQSVSRITETDRFTICLAAVDNNAIGRAMPLQGPFEEALGRRQITAFAEEELNSVPNAVNGAIQIP